MVPVRRASCAEASGQRLVELYRQYLAGERRDRRAGAVGRQLQRLWHAGELLGPVVQLSPVQTVGASTAEQVTLPQRVVGVLNRQWSPSGRRPVAPAVYAAVMSSDSGPSDQPSAAMWCSGSSSTAS